MRFSSFLLWVVATILSGSCTKSSEKNPGNNPGFLDSSSFYLVKTLTEDWSEGATNLYHNTDTFYYGIGNRIEAVFSDSAHINFEYNGSVIVKNVYPRSAHEEHYYYYFNSASLLDSSVLITDTSSVHTVYTYAGTQVTQKVETTISDRGDTTNEYVYKYQYDAKGNTLYIDRYFDTLHISESMFTYSDSINFSTSADMMYPDKIHSPNLLKSELYSPDALPTGEQDTYSYEADNRNRIKTVTCSIVPLNFEASTRILTYTYY